MFLLGLKRSAWTSMWPWTEPWMLPFKIALSYSRTTDKEGLIKGNWTWLSLSNDEAPWMKHKCSTTKSRGLSFNPLFNEYKLEGCLNFHHNSQTVQLGPVAPLSGVYINRVSSEAERQERAVAFWRCVMCVRATTDRFKSSSELLTHKTKTFRSTCLPCRGQECPPQNGDC